ncbi:MAG: hypothetical protein WA749_02350 [Gelidibacter sp.]
MKKAFFNVIAIRLCSVAVLTLTQLYKKNTETIAPIVEQRDNSGIDPFADATRVELVTYKSDRMDWWSNECGQDKPLLENGRLNMLADSIHSRVNLDAQAIAKWQSTLYVQHFCAEKITGLCYQPRHLLLFYTPDNRAYGYIEICLSCSGGRMSEGLREVVFCPERVEYLATLVREVQR